MNIAFYVSGNAGRLRKILQQPYEGVLQSTKLIFSDDKQNISLEKEVADAGIKYYLLDHQSIEKTETKSKNMIMSDDMLAQFKKYNIDYCFSFGGHLLMGDLLKEYQNKIINFHPSILPMFPGMLSIDKAVEAKSNLLGNTAHFIDAGMDTGPIIMQSIMSNKLFSPADYDSVLGHQLTMFNQIFSWLESDRLKIENNAVIIKGADYTKITYYPASEI